MDTPAPRRWSALIIHLTDGASNLVQLLEQQGYELAEQWDGPVAWRPDGPRGPDLAHLDLTRTSQSGTVLFLQTVAQLRSPVVAVTEFPDSHERAAASHPGRSYLLRKRGDQTSA